MKPSIALLILLCGCALPHKRPARQPPVPPALHHPQAPDGLRQTEPVMTALPVLVSGNPALTLGWTVSTAQNIVSQTLGWGVQSTVYTNTVQLPPQANQFQVTNLIWSTTYFFGVRCTDVNGLNSAWSTELMYTTTNIPPQAPPPPTNLKVISVP